MGDVGSKMGGLEGVARVSELTWVLECEGGRGC